MEADESAPPDVGDIMYAVDEEELEVEEVLNTSKAPVYLVRADDGEKYEIELVDEVWEEVQN